MKTLKLLGIIAVTALIIIGVTACEDPLGLLDEDKIFPETAVTFKVSTYGPFTGKPLEAYYNGDENVSYQWYTDGS
jgi:hypothetical protein